MAYPALANRDGHPLSTYPMYANRRDDVVSLVVAVGIEASGEREALSLETISEGDDPLIAEARLQTAVSEGRAAAVCEDIAARVPDRFTNVELATERVDLLAHLRGDAAAVLDRRAHATCAVP